MSEWKPAPGDVALVRNEWNVWNVAICTLRADKPGWWWRFGVADSWSPIANPGVRRLVTIDPEDCETGQRLAYLYDSRAAGPCAGEDMQAALREFTNPKPPRPEEPTTWGVVEAACCHYDGRQKWVHHPDGNWWPAFDYSKVPERTPLPDSWDDLIDPVVIREGVVSP